MQRVRVIMSKRVSKIIVLVVALVSAGIFAYSGTHYHGNSHAATLPSCTISATLVNSCRPWAGETTGGYTMVGSDTISQTDFANKRLNDANVLTNPSATVTLTHQLDVVHTYHSFGSNTLSAADVTIAKRANTILFTNWKPADPWVNGNGSNTATNANIDAMANSIKALGSTKIMLTLYHEPENNVSVNNCTTNSPKATSGSPADYVAMWHNVRAHFDKLGVTNVVWVMNYMGYSGWNCLVPQLWPGNSYVDWIVYDPYGGGSSLFAASVRPFYTYLSNNSDTTHDYLSKPWGLGEYGYGSFSSQDTQANAIQYMVDAKNSIANNTFPRLKVYTAFDTNVNGDTQVGYDFSGNISVPEQSAYNAFLDTIFALQSSPTTLPTASPTPAPTTSPTPLPTTSPSPSPGTSPTPTPTVSPTPTPLAVPGDFTNDGHVTAADLAILLSHWNQMVAPGTLGDCNDDGQVTVADLAVVLTNWGK